MFHAVIKQVVVDGFSVPIVIVTPMISLIVEKPVIILRIVIVTLANVCLIKVTRAIVVPKRVNEVRVPVVIVTPVGVLVVIRIVVKISVAFLIEVFQAKVVEILIPVIKVPCEVSIIVDWRGLTKGGVKCSENTP